MFTLEYAIYTTSWALKDETFVTKEDAVRKATEHDKTLHGNFSFLCIRDQQTDRRLINAAQFYGNPLSPAISD